jgi:hypothetical protein
MDFNKAIQPINNKKSKTAIFITILIIVYYIFDIISIVTSSSSAIYDLWGSIFDPPPDFNITIEPYCHKAVAGNISEIEIKVCIEGNENVDPIKLSYDLLSELEDNDISVELPLNEIRCPPLECVAKIHINKNLKNGTYEFRVIGIRMSDGLQRNCTFKLVLLPRRTIPPHLLSLSSDISSYTSPPGFYVNWTAEAQDPEQDKIYYKYFLMGPIEDNCHQWKPQFPGDGWSENSYFLWNTKNYKHGTYYIGVGVAELYDGNYIRSNSNWFLNRIFNISDEEFIEIPPVAINETIVPAIFNNETIIPAILNNETIIPAILNNEIIVPAILNNETIVSDKPSVPEISEQMISVEEFKGEISNKCIDYEKISQRLDSKDVWIAGPNNNSIKYEHNEFKISYENPISENCEIIVTLEENKPTDVRSVFNFEDQSYIPIKVSDLALKDLSKFFCS